MTDYAGWAQAGVASAIAAAGGLVGAGYLRAQVSDQQQRVTALEDKQSKDHDKVTRLDEKVTQIQSDVSETKSDVKTILQNQTDVKAALDRYNRKVDHGTR